MRFIISFGGAILNFAFFVTAAVIVYAAPSAADEIHGSVKDALERPLSGAELLLKAPNDNIVGKTVSDSEGNYEFLNVAPGSYAVWAEKSGFKKSSLAVTVGSGSSAPVVKGHSSYACEELYNIADAPCKSNSCQSRTRYNSNNKTFFDQYSTSFPVVLTDY
ncbi:MAG TPA: hypothetical protein DCP92_14690 [Nitrospiraceae bacterium]|jgi:hypothetical protein|nr:hypothetical protein [Nitrospiraceae bacterium]